MPARLISVILSVGAWCSFGWLARTDRDRGDLVEVSATGRVDASARNAAFVSRQKDGREEGRKTFLVSGIDSI